ncbi:hypothetical protein FT663_00607 [Candidozyma haemuli var. vulneris]|uniref:Uncharacterized protein n=1 Tax=Candidozyma haemuli TaxID=45357 RepID=A0A2V1APB5_9ASCO|nr:hypothetical protein CXQ85_003390 [[Candida] haemuloni]KAF3989015.1 hypothetical protein FT662_03076 [[Candida] haemuloni var. vulneris]KAF3995229.1 hypothetical protein FT663_00607 [[Candida] haemuloni var. vulneris]PVH19544.1 hypothetical protein CXQ85_003390 [[Candida] haemuloni]
MAISKPFVNAREPTKDEKIMLYIMALIAPPCPFFVLTGPNYTCRTWEFFVSVMLQLACVAAIVVGRGFNIIWLLVQAVSYVYSFRFVHSGFQKGRSLSTGYMESEQSV